MAGGGETTAGMKKIEAAHEMFRDGNYEDALSHYTEALSLARSNPQKMALHSNRAACFLKLHRFKSAAEECTAVLELDQDHAGALMLRAQTLVTLKDYHSALFDVNRLVDLNPSSDAYRNLESRLRTQLSLAPIPEESDAELEEEEVEEPGEAESSEAESSVQWEEEAEADCAAAGTTQMMVSGAVFEDSLFQGRDRGIVEPRKSITAEVIAQAQRKAQPRKAIAAEAIAQSQKTKEVSQQPTRAWQAIPKPKGHSALDYARWDRVEDDSSDDSDDNDDEEDSQPQYRFRVKTVGVSSVK